jgi:gamma-glutamylcyclotransferase (GGCT)/AIG2-like uncharacterized protein YtfP
MSENHGPEQAVFVYGTLRGSEHNYRLLRGRTSAEFPACLPGHALYADGIPYILPALGAEVVGELMILKPQVSAAVIARLDYLEGFAGPGRPHNLYERCLRKVVYVTDSGERSTRPAWVYVAGSRIADRGGAPEPSGDWLQARARRRLRVA